MTCDDFHSMLADSDTREVTNAELMACFKHSRECSKCKQLCEDLASQLDSKSLADAANFAFQKMLEITQARLDGDTEL